MKINWKKFTVATFAGALLLTGAAVAFSQGPQGPPPGPGGGFRGGPGMRDGFGPFGRDLNLTDDQKAQIKKITGSFRENTQALHEQMRTLHQNESDPMSGTFDEAAVRAAAEARAKIQIELEVLHAKMMSEIATVLTAEQKAQLAERHKHFERQGPPPPQPRSPEQP